MRPKIPDTLTERITAVYEEAGYATESEFIRDAIRRRLDAVEQDTKPEAGDGTFDFEYELSAESDGNTPKKRYPTLYLRPEGAHVSKPNGTENSLILHVESKAIEETVLQDEIGALDVVHTCALAAPETAAGPEADDGDGWMYVVLDDDQVDAAGLDESVSRILQASKNTIQTAEGWENRRQELANAMRRHTGE